MSYTPVAGGRNNFFCKVGAEVTRLILGGSLLTSAPTITLFPARIEKWPHRWENRCTGGKMARTEWQIARTD
jgi:hypothetical protein